MRINDILFNAKLNPKLLKNYLVSYIFFLFSVVVARFVSDSFYLFNAFFFWLSLCFVLFCFVFIFIVLVPPEFVKRPENISIDEGDTIILECEVRGFPVPQITWYLSDSALSNNNSLVEIVNAKKADHEGVYRCEAKNPAGAVSASAVVTVNGKVREKYI